MMKHYYQLYDGASLRLTKPNFRILRIIMANTEKTKSKFDLIYINSESEFLQNTWYVIARDDEIQQRLESRKILGTNILLYRDSEGHAVALDDACPHRKLPLSMGKLCGDTVQCGYHGLTFDASGKCISAPTQDRIPDTAVVRSYPIAERYGLLWVWMGEPQLADESKILQVEDYEDSAWGRTEGGVLECKCHYLLLLDNLLDPSHVAWVHQTSFASAGTTNVPLEMSETDDGVVVSRWINNIDPPPYYAPMLCFSGKVDRYQHYEARMPAVAVNIGTYTQAGLGGDDDNLPENAYRMRSYHFITPVDSNTTRYFWFQHYNTNISDQAVKQSLNDGARSAFEEDRVVLEAVHAGLNSHPRPTIDLRLDKGARDFRKKLDGLIRAEKLAVKQR
jgi:phenylpropionate dioxygenase-like ring-hydroxylating dioxygenase large terminal subunit